MLQEWEKILTQSVTLSRNGGHDDAKTVIREGYPPARMASNIGYPDYPVDAGGRLASWLERMNILCRIPLPSAIVAQQHQGGAVGSGGGQGMF